MISQEKWLILTPLQKLPKNLGDSGKLIVARGLKTLPKFQKIAQSGHTACDLYAFHCWDLKHIQKLWHKKWVPPWPIYGKSKNKMTFLKNHANKK